MRKWRVAFIYSNNPDTTGSRCVEHLCWKFIDYKRLVDPAVCGHGSGFSYTDCHTYSTERV
jgi:hypothetical protein